MALRKLFSVWNLIFLLAALTLVLLVVYPMYAIFQASLLSAETGAFTWDNYLSVFTTPFYRRCLWNSLFMSGLATFFSVLIGVPFAFFTTRYKLPGATALRTLGTLPLILPTFIGAEAWLLLLGRNGIITRFFADLGLHIPSIYGWQGVVLVFTLQFFPFVFLMVGAAINSVDRSLEEAARNLGASPWRVFRTVTLPVVTPAIASGALIVFCMSIENFGVPTIIGNDYKVLAEQAYSEFVSEMGGQPFHGGHAEHRAGGGYPGPHRAAEAVGGTKKLRHVRAAPAGNQNPAPPGQGAGLGLLRPCRLYFPGALCHGHGGGCDQNQRTGPLLRPVYAGQPAHRPEGRPRPILNSFFLSTTATVIGMVFGLAVSYLVVRKGGVIGYALDLAMMLPLVIAGSVLGIALAATYNTGPVVLTGTWMIIVLAYFIRKTPFSVKTTSALLRQIEVSVEEASISLGVPPLRTFLKVVVPAMLPGVAAGAIIMWVTTLAELSSTIVLYYGPWSTMTVQVFQYIGSGDFGPASAYGAILIVSVLAPLFILNKALGKDLTTSL